MMANDDYFDNQGCEWEFKKRTEIVLQLVKKKENLKKWPENTRKSTFWVFIFNF